MVGTQQGQMTVVVESTFCYVFGCKSKSLQTRKLEGSFESAKSVFWR
jgi:hypothetical protein